MIRHTAIKVLARIIDRLEVEESADPLLAVIAIISGAGAYHLLTGWREEWGRRTALGRFGLVISAPFRVAVGVLLGGVFLAYVVLTVLFMLPAIFVAIVDELADWYRERAVREDARRST